MKQNNLYQVRRISNRTKPPMGEQECRPNYAEMAERQASELKIVKNLGVALTEFLRMLRPYHREKDGLPLLYRLGTLLIDVVEREIELERTLELAEKHND
jgi:hypothetical protein